MQKKKQFGREAASLTLLMVLVALAALVYAKWDKDQKMPFGNLVSLPPESSILKFEEGEVGGRDRWLYNCRSSLSADAVLTFYQDSFVDWQREEVVAEKNYRYKKDDYEVQIMVHPDPAGSVFTLIVRKSK